MGFGELEFLAGAEVNITGGTLDFFRVFPGSEVNLFGSDFVQDGVSLDLAFGETLFLPPITEFGSSTLSGLLADGSAFSFFLGNVTPNTLTVTSTAVPEPTSLAILLLGCGLAGTRRIRFAS